MRRIAVLFIALTAALGLARADELPFSERNARITTTGYILGLIGAESEFRKFSGVISFDQDETVQHIFMTAETASIWSDDEDRLADLRGPDFFDIERFPVLSFESQSVAPGRAGRARITGQLTLRGITAPVTFDARYKTEILATGAKRVTFSAKGEVDRTQFGMVAKRGVLSDSIDFEMTGTLDGPPPAPATP